MMKVQGALFGLMLSIISHNMGVNAQIIVDPILQKSDRTTIKRSTSLNKWLIEGGAIRGDNLFHLFSQFSPNNDSVEFLVENGSNKIFAIVTGSQRTRINSSISIIDKIQKTPANVDFYLVNPRGINLQSQASLSFNGDLFLTTADRIGFGRQGHLEITPQSKIPLLSTNPTDFSFRRFPSSKVAINGAFLDKGFSVLAPLIDITDLFLLSNSQELVLGSLKQGRYSLNSTSTASVSSNSTRGDIGITRSILFQNSDESSSTVVFGKNLTLDDSFILNFGSPDSLGDILINLEKDLQLFNSTISGNNEIKVNIANGNVQLIESSFIQSLSQGDITFDIGGHVQLGKANLESPASTGSIGNTNGDIHINALSIDIKQQSSINTSTVDENASGNIFLTAAEKISLQGQDSVIAASPSLDSAGDAGSISIMTPQLVIRDGASIRVGSGLGQAGTLSVHAQSLSLDRGFITAETGLEQQDSNGANILLNISDTLDLKNDSRITATARGNTNGGNILILNTPRLRATYGPGLVESGNDIIADAFNGKGGNIIANTQGEPEGFEPSLSGLFRSNLPSDINTISSLNMMNNISATGSVPGFVDVDTVTEVNQGVLEFPEVLIDPNSLVAQNPCSRGSESEFTLSGRGGLPNNLIQTLNNTSSQVDFIESSVDSSLRQENTNYLGPHEGLHKVMDTQPERHTIPAQGWVYDHTGNIKLTAYNNPTHSENIRKTSPLKSCSS